MKKYSKIIVTILIIVVIGGISLNVILPLLNKTKFKKIFHDTSILTKGYTYNGLTRLNIHPESFTMRYSEYDKKNVKGAEVEIKGSTKIKNADTLLLIYDGGSITCSILAVTILDCNDAVFRRYDGYYSNEQKCMLSPSEAKAVLDAGLNDAYYDRQGASYDNPYEKTDPCYQAYDSQYSTGVHNGYLRSSSADRAYDEARKGNACLGMGGTCFNTKR